VDKEAQPAGGNPASTQAANVPVTPALGSAANRAGSFDGLYRGTKTPGFNAPQCDARPDATWQVSDNTVTVQWGNGYLKGHIEQDGRFEASLFVYLHLTRLTGRIEGRKLTANLDDPNCKYRFDLTREQR
jgi:hypothetical protein